MDNYDYDAILNQSSNIVSTQITQTQPSQIVTTQNPTSSAIYESQQFDNSQLQTPSSSDVNNNNNNNNKPKVVKNPALTLTKKVPKAFGKKGFSSNERERIRDLLQRRLTSHDVESRPGANGVEYTYLSSNRAIEIANETFQYNGWSCSIVDVTPDFIEEREGKFRCGVSAVVRILLKDGTFHEDVGFGCKENPSKPLAIENAKKEAISDARKRALRLFGNHLGNCLYDKDQLRKVRSGSQSSQSSQQMSQYPTQQTQQYNNRSSFPPKAASAPNPTMYHNNNHNNNNINNINHQQNVHNNSNNINNQQNFQQQRQQFPNPQQHQNSQQIQNSQMTQNSQQFPHQNSQQIQNSQPIHMQQQQFQNNQRPPTSIPQAPYIKLEPNINTNNTNNINGQINNGQANNRPTNLPQQQQQQTPITFNNKPQVSPLQQPVHINNNNTNVPLPSNNNGPVVASQIPVLSDDTFDFAEEEALLLAESQYAQKTALKSSPPSNDEAQSLTPPDKKRRQDNGIDVK